MPEQVKHIIAIPVPTQSLLGPANAYVLPGEPLTLIDPGPATPEALSALVEGLAELGLAAGDVRQIVVTHSHVDHCGIAGQICAGSTGRLTVFAHPSGHAPLTRPADTTRDRLDLLNRAGVAAHVPRELLDAGLAHVAARQAGQTAVPAHLVQPLGHGQQLTAGGNHWTALHTPGHAADHLNLFQSQAQVLVVGDLLLRHLSTIPSLEAKRPDGRRPGTLADLVASWRRVGRLDVAVAWPGHGSPIRAHRLLVARRLAGVRQRLRATRAAVLGGATTIWEVATALGHPATPEAVPQALGETVALVDWLSERGRLRRATSDGVVVLAGD